MDVIKRVRLLVVVGLVAATTAAGAAVAVTAGASTSGPTYYACLRSGKLIDVGAAAPSCPGNAQQISWNAQGSPGPTGAQGPVGQASVVNVPTASLFASQCPVPPGPNPSPAGPTGTQAFLGIPSIPGESTDSNHLNQIDVLSWSLGVGGGSGSSCPGSRSSTGQGASGDQLSIVKYVDKSSPALMLAVVEGAHLGSATLSVSRVSNGTLVDYLVYTFTDVTVTGSQWLGNGDRPEEQVTFQYAKIQVSYSQQKPDGTLASPILACFDIEAQVGC